MVQQPYIEIPYVVPGVEEAEAVSDPVQSSPDLGVSDSRHRWYLGDDMVKRILGILALAVVGYLVFLGYTRYRDNALEDSGAVQQRDGSIRSVPEDADSAPASKPLAVYAKPAAQPIPGASSPAATAAPVADSIAPSPANGATFAGTGKFQVYRQGNLTWRLDTDTGKSCVLFATMEEWKKSLVYEHGCNN